MSHVHAPTPHSKGPRRALGVLGDPIEHSLSPAMHAAALAALGLPHVYLPFRVHPAGLRDALIGAASLGFLGLNLTVPHKRTALEHLDELSTEARRVGAVNTVAFPRGPDGQIRRVGHNTDGFGFSRALDELSGRAIRRAVVMGSGGASLAVVDALLHEVDVESLWLVSRRPADIESPLARDPRVRTLDYAGWTQAAAAAPSELWVNTTTVGMKGGPTAFPEALPFEQLENEARAMDIVYPRPAGGWLDTVAGRGVRTVDGRPMLLWQGVRALEIWLDRSLPDSAVDAMAATLGLSN